MGETAEERARRLELRHGEPRWYTMIRIDVDWDMEGERRMINPDVSLVKKYSKGTFKF